MTLFKGGINLGLFILESRNLLYRHSLIIHVASDWVSVIINHFTFIFRMVNFLKKSYPYFNCKVVIS